MEKERAISSKALTLVEAIEDKNTIRILRGPSAKELHQEDPELVFELEAVGEVKVRIISTRVETGSHVKNKIVLIFTLAYGRHDNYYHAKYNIRTRSGIIFNAFNKFPDF